MLCLILILTHLYIVGDTASINQKDFKNQHALKTRLMKYLIIKTAQLFFQCKSEIQSDKLLSNSCIVYLHHQGEGQIIIGAS